MFHPSKKFIGVETLKPYNPSTAHRRKERNAEKKKNKAERKVTREQVLLKKNPAAIKEELDKLEEMLRTGQPMPDSRSRRLQKLQQLWAQVVSSVEAERRVLTADVSSVAAADNRSGGSSTSAKCLQQRLSHGERVPEEDERRYYCPELCNTGIFRHPDGSVRPYPPLVANDRSEQRRRFVESQQRQSLERRGVPREFDMSSDSGSDEEGPSGAAGGNSGSKKSAAEAAQAPEAVEDFLASIPLPAEPPPTGDAPAPAAAAPATEKQLPAAAPPMPFMPMPFPVLPVGAYGGAAAPQQAGGPPIQGTSAGSAPFFPPAFMSPFSQIPAPPPQLLAHMHGQMATQQQPMEDKKQQCVPPPQQLKQQPNVKVQEQQQRLPSPIPLHNEQKRPAVLRAPMPPAKKQQTVARPTDAADLKAAIAFVPTHLRTKKLPATAKAQEGPSISRVSAYSMGAGALSRQAAGAGGSADGEATSGLARFLGEAKKQQNEAAARAQQKSTPADLDKAFDEFLKEVGAA